MKYILLNSFLLIFAITACNTSSDPKDINQLFKDYYQERLLFYPLQATSAGDHRYDDLLPNNISQKYRDDLRAFYKKYNSKLNGFDRSTLTPEQQTSYDVLNWECEISLDGLQYPDHYFPIDQFWTLNIEISKLAGGKSYQPFRNATDYDNWLKRLNGFVAWSDSAISNMRRGISKGYVLPASLIKKVIPQIATFSKGPVEEHLYYTPVKSLPQTIPAKERTRIAKNYRQMIENKIIPAFKRLETFLRNDYLAAGRTTSGYDALPDGKDWYQHQIRKFTTTNMTADEIFNLGKMEVERISGLMEKVKEQVGYSGDLVSFFDYVRNKAELMPYSKPRQVLDHFEQIHEKMKPNLKKLFDLVPKTPFEIRRTEAFREASASAEYNQGSADGSRPGIFYVPVPDARKYNIFQDESLFLHEAIPGHHYQISLQQENNALPKFRKFLWYSAYGEGWALYSESLGSELGLYDDPYQYFGMLSAEMHRAIRLVVDTGIHAKGWTREQAIQYSIEHEAESKANVISEIERYMAMPGQALSYKIGQLKIRQLRAQAESRLVDDFDIREFHNKILESGCLPLDVLEKKINNWVAEKRAE